jgi:uncharacterized protein
MNDAPPKQSKFCPVCSNRLETVSHKPFCSERCRNKDLLNWLSDGYAIAGHEGPDENATSDDNQTKH